MVARPDWLWDVVVPVVQWGAAVLVCVWLATWLAGVLRRMDEESVPGAIVVKVALEVRR